MTSKVVEAVLVQDVGISTFKAIYGRHVQDSSSYTKYFLQLNTGCRRIIEGLIPLNDTVPDSGFKRTDVQLVWPGGSALGHLQETTDARLQLHWSGEDGTPEPWRLGLGDDAPDRRLPGDDTHTTAAEADSVFHNDVEALDAVLLAVKLRGDDSRLHLRVAMKSPPPEAADAGFEHLPAPIRECAEAALDTNGCKAWAASDPVRATQLVERILEALKRGPNVLVVGPPGTGKTVAMEDLRRLSERGSVHFDPSKLYGNWDQTPSAMARFVVFHSSYRYEDFMIRLTPEVSANEAAQGGFSLKAEPGPLASLAHYASDPNRHALLLIDEFNRGNASAIFGDTLALLDKDKRYIPSVPGSGESITRAFPDMKVEVREEYANPNGREIPEEFRLPATLQIVAALNSSDRSVAPLDAALRRRFRIVRAEPDLDLLRSHFEIGSGGTTPSELDGGSDAETANVQQLAVRLISELNDRIRLALGEDFLLGHALVWGVTGETVEVATSQLAAAFDEQIVATLRMTLVDQDDALAAILNVASDEQFDADAPRVGGWIEPPVGLQGVAERRLRLNELSAFDDTERVWEALERVL